MELYHYKACGLDNVFIAGLAPVTDDDGHKAVEIPRINLLHHAIAQAIITSSCAMRGDELRFIRTEMGYTQAELARLVHREPLAISRWERGEGEIDANAEIIIRLLAIEVLELGISKSVEEISARVIPSAKNREIRIDGHDPNAYKPVAA